MKFPPLAGMCLLFLAALPCAGWTQSCTVSATSVVFSSYDPLSPANTTSTGTTTVNCTEQIFGFGGGSVTIPFTASLSTGNSGNYSTRYLLSGTQQLNYNLFSNATYTTIWGNGTGGSQSVNDNVIAPCSGFIIETCTGSKADTVYGLVPARQDAVPGSYSDTITVTVTF